MKAAARSSTNGADRKSREWAGGAAAIPLSMYTTPPDEEMALEEFECFAMDRLYVLRLVEALRARGVERAQFNTAVDEALAKHLPLALRETGAQAAFGAAVMGADDDDEYAAQAAARRADDERKDRVSHFILRVAYSRTEELRRWFLRYECDLFKLRLEKLPPAALARFAAAQGSALEALAPVAEPEKAARREQLAAVLPAQLRAAGHGEKASAAPAALLYEVDKLRYYRVHFTQCLDLVARREVRSGRRRGRGGGGGAL